MIPPLFGRLNNWFSFLSAGLRACGVLERRCTACDMPFIPEQNGTAAGHFFCETCRQELVRREAGYCPYCGEPSAWADAPCMPCGRCLRSLPPWQEFLFFGVYEGLLRQELLRGKFGGDLAALNALGTLLAERCAEFYEAAPLPDVIVPVPLHLSRLKERGFNQCRELARPLSRFLKIPVDVRLLTRPLFSTAQAQLGRKLRKELIQPFAASSMVKGQRILLVDDVCTTGTTLRHATECLFHAGAVQVDVAVLARASIRT